MSAASHVRRPVRTGDRYREFEGGIFNGAASFIGGTAIDATPAANEFFVSIGAESGQHLVFDNNRIASKTNATTWGNLLLQPHGGNVGIATTPSPWHADWKTLQIGSATALYSHVGFDTGLANNLYYDGTNFRAINAGAGSLLYQATGQLQFHNAPVGAAGAIAPITLRFNTDINGKTCVGGTPTDNATLINNAQLFQVGVAANTVIGQVLRSSSTGAIHFSDTDAAAPPGNITYNHTTDTLSFNAASAARAYIHSTGLSVGTSAVGENVYVAGNLGATSASTNSTYLALRNTAASGRAWSMFSSGGGPIAAGGFGIYDETAGANRFQINSEGNYGFGIAPIAANSAYRTAHFGGSGYHLALATGSGAYYTAENLYVDSAIAWRAIGTGGGSIHTQAGGAHAFWTSPSVAAGALATITARVGIELDGRLWGNALHNNTGPITGTANQYVASRSNFTPTYTSVTNLDAAPTHNALKVDRTGNTVTFSGSANFNPTAAGLCQARFSLPIASGFTTAYDANGTCGGYNTNEGGMLYSDAANDEIVISFVAVRTDLHEVSYVGSYEVK